MTISKFPVGLNIPITKGDKGYFDQTYDDVEQYKINLINLVKTKQGERLFNPLFGSSLYKILFEQNDYLDDYSVLKVSLQNDVNLWIPQIKIENVNIKQDISNVDIYKIEVVVTFSVIRTGQVETISIQINN